MRALFRRIVDHPVGFSILTALGLCALLLIGFSRIA